MVQFMSTEKRDNVWQSPEPEVSSFGVPVNFNEIEEEGPVPKRWKCSSPQTTNQEWSLNCNEFAVPPSQYNPLSETSLLGLRLRKSPSLLELAQMRLNQGHTDKGALPTENLEAGTKRDLRARARTRTSSSIDKLKASHFPALLLRIGQWEYVSKHEGDLVAKCYFSKHKIVWEVLDGGLKKKLEINWADIVALKANCPDNGPGTLTILLDKQPLFFNEINPQPRKHTQWQATSDFTNGEASTHRQHFLQCAQGVLDKHYDKLIQSDTQLNFLSQQQDAVVDLPYFAAEASVEVPSISGNSSFNLQEITNIAHVASPSTLQPCSSKAVGSSALSLVHQDMSIEAQTTDSVMSAHPEGQKDNKQLKTLMLRPTISMSDLVNHIGDGLPERQLSVNPPFSDDILGQECPKDMLESISQILLSDSHLTEASDERSLMSRVNSLCCLLQDYQNGQQDGNDRSAPDSNRKPQQDRHGSCNRGTHLMTATGTQEDHFSGFKNASGLSTKPQHGNDGSTHDSNVMQDGNDCSNPEPDLTAENVTQQDGNISGLKQASGISRKDSFTDMVHQLPRIASLPNFLFDISEGGEILR